MPSIPSKNPSNRPQYSRNLLIPFFLNVINLQTYSLLTFLLLFVDW